MYDLSGNGEDGLYSGTTAVGFSEPPLLAQSHGTSQNFSPNAYVDLGVGPFDYIHQTGTFSIVGWVRFDQLTTQNPVLASSQLTAHKGFRIDTANGKLRAMMMTGSSNRLLVSTTTLETDRTYLFAFVGNGTNFYLYLDGRLEASTTAITASGAATNTLQIGRYPTTLTYLQGSLDDVFFLDVAATQDQLAAYFLTASGADRFGDAPHCDPEGDIWECECPTMSGSDTCEVVTMDSATDMSNPSSLNCSGWLTTTWSTTLGAWIVDIDLDSMPSKGLMFAPSNEGIWDDYAEYLTYVSDLLDVPIDTSTGQLEPFIVRQLGMASVYFTDGTLRSSSDMYLVLTANSQGEVWIDGDQVVADDVICDARDRSIPDDCSWSGHPDGRCWDFDAAKDGSLLVRGGTRLTLLQGNGPAASYSCWDNEVAISSSNNYVTTPSMIDVAATNNVACVDAGGTGSFCTLRPLDELVIPNRAPSHPQYLGELKVRRWYTRGLIEMDTYSFREGSHYIVGQISAMNALQVREKVRDPRGYYVEAACGETEIVRGSLSVTIVTGAGDEDSPSSLPTCAEP